MGNVVVVKKDDGSEESFTDILGHNIGNGAIQILFMNGNSRIIFHPEDVTITLDEEGSTKFENDMKMQLAATQAAQDGSANDGTDKPVDEVEVPLEH